MVWSLEYGSFEIDKWHTLSQTRQRRARQEAENVRGSLWLHTWDVVWQHGWDPYSPAFPIPPFSLIHLPHLISEFIFSLQQRKDHLGLSFSSSGLFFFADKCSPIHHDRCHMASLPFWYIASDPATCNKEPAPGTLLPRQRSDTGDYFKRALLVLLSAEVAGCHVCTQPPPCPP